MRTFSLAYGGGPKTVCSGPVEQNDIALVSELRKPGRELPICLSCVESERAHGRAAHLKPVPSLRRP